MILAGKRGFRATRSMHGKTLWKDQHLCACNNKVRILTTLPRWTLGGFL